MDGAAARDKLLRDQKLDDDVVVLGLSPRAFRQCIDKEIDLDDSTVYYLDNCPSIEAVEDAYDRGAQNVHVLDHHAGNESEFDTLPTQSGDVRILDLTGPVSGVGVVAQFTKVPLVPFEIAVQCRDTFKYSAPWTKDNTEILYKLVPHDMTTASLEPFLNMTTPQLLDAVVVAEPIIRNSLNELFSSLETRLQTGTWTVDGLPPVRVCYGNVMPFDVTGFGSYMVGKTEANMLICVNYNGFHPSYSLRALKRGFDCLPWAQAKGGGGHKAACGFSQRVTPGELVFDA